MDFSASVFQICSFAVAAVLLATTAAARPATSTIATVAAANATVTARRDGHGRSSPLSTATTEEQQQYICYLCRGRNPLMIRWCPLDEDECHVACLSSPSASRASSSSSSSPPRAPALPADDDDRGHDDCYVMKLYPDGSWVVVDVVSCQASAGCFLVCSDAYALPSSSTGAAGETTPAAIGSPLPPRLADFERCGDQLYPRPSSP
ncbi:uncharacterized protein LOC121054006 [Oryza brachyantha]|uniref:uncharacterized protein LOC121054006 n=1 Tax=Oryza brachyantha TaxID=4533 RepID=UPI001ADC3AC1|nr:uncharacterized protein LOC121054006 [Oryza brachyantha]